MNEILFITANKNEKTAFLEAFKPNGESITVNGKLCNLGTFGVYPSAHIHILEQGPNRAEAMPVINEVIKKLVPIAVVAIGIAFGADEESQKIGDVLISKLVIPYDDQKVLEDGRLYKSDPVRAGYRLTNAFSDIDGWRYQIDEYTSSKPWFGYLLSGSKLLNNLAFKRLLLQDFADKKPIGGDMEAAALYEICRERGISEWIVIKGICDWGHKKSNPNKERDQLIAAKAAVSLCQYVFFRHGIFEETVKPQFNRTITDWNDAPPHMEIFGRQCELDIITDSKIKGKQIFCLVGAGGIGKSTLARNWADTNFNDCKFISWISFKNRPDLKEIFWKLNQFLCPEQAIPKKSIDEHIFEIIALLNKTASIIIFDNLESIMQSGESTGLFLEEYLAIERFLTRFSDGKSLSTVLLTTRELPQVVEKLKSDTDLCDYLPLKGLNEDAIPALVRSHGLEYNDKNKLLAFSNHHGGSPYAIAILAPIIRNDYNSLIDHYVDAGCPLPASLIKLLDTQIQRLTQLQRVILLRIAVERVPVSLKNLQTAFESLYDRMEIINAIDQLRHKSLLEPPINGDEYYIQNVLLDYAMDSVCVEMSNSILKLLKNQDPNNIDLILRDLPVLVAMSSNEIRAAQRRTFVAPIFNAIRAKFLYSLPKLKMLFYKTIRMIGNEIEYVGYATGTLITMMLQCEPNLNGLDLSSLRLWSCDFEHCDLIDTNFSCSDLRFSRFREVLAAVNTISFGNTAKKMYFGTSDGVVHFQDVEQNIHFAKRVHAGYVRSLVYNSLNHTLITAGEDKTLHVLNADTFIDIEEVIHENEPLRFVTLSSDGNTLIWGGENGLIVRKYGDKIVRSYDGTHEMIRDCCFFNEEIISYVTENGSVKLGNLNEDLKCFKTAIFPDEPLWCVTATSQAILVSGKQGKIHLLDSNLNELNKKFDLANSPVWHIQDVEDFYIATTSGGEILYYDKQSACIVYRWMAHTNWIRALAVDKSKQFFACGSADQSIRIYEISSRALQFGLEGESINFLSVVDAGDCIIAGGTDGVLHCWKDNKDRRIHTKHTDLWIRALAYSIKYKIVAIGYSSGLIEIWDPAQEKIQGIVWDPEQEKNQAIVKHPSEDVWALDFHPDKPLLLSASENGTVLEWQKDQLGNWSPATIYKFERWAISARYNYNGDYIACGDGLGRVIITDRRNLVELPIQDNSDQAWGIAWLRNRESVLVAERSGNLRIWRNIYSSVPQCETIARKKANWGAASSLNGGSVAVVSDSGEVTLYYDNSITVKQIANNRLDAVDYGKTDDSYIIAGYDGFVIKINGNGELLKKYCPDRQYSRLNVSDALSLTASQLFSIKQFGGVENDT